MALVEIHDVQAAPVNPERLRAFSLDTPAPGTTADVYDVEIAGWVLGPDIAAGAVEIHVEGTVLRRVPLDQRRADVARDYPGVEGAETSGFRTWVSVVGLEPGADLQVRAVMKDESRVRLGTVKLSHQPLRSGFDPTLRPLMLTTLGRAGTTWTMRLFSEHPKIVVHRWHPYELRASRYFMHAFKVTSEPKDPYRSAQADFFQTDKSWVGHNPFYPEPANVTPGLREWFGREQVEHAAAFAQRSSEECYKRIAAAQGVEAPVFFAEKHRADYLPWLYWELYPNAKEVFLVRDFRDVVSSMLAFNAKHGRRVFGHDRLESDEEFFRFVRNGPVRLLSRNWPKRQDRAHLVRYEDLIGEPRETLRGVLAYLELDHDDATIDGMLARAGEDKPETRRHITSGGASSSIGRWRSSLAPDAQTAANDIFGDALQQFGYAV
ncbi:MAG: sulfotransferase [Chloroflexota bacterium]|nr:sulfotransferase [Chloroflexota bacterium]